MIVPTAVTEAIRAMANLSARFPNVAHEANDKSRRITASIPNISACLFMLPPAAANVELSCKKHGRASPERLYLDLTALGYTDRPRYFLSDLNVWFADILCYIYCEFFT